MNDQTEINVLKEILVSSTPEWEKMKQAAQRLYEVDQENAFAYFISLIDLDNKHNWSRNVAALMLREIKDDRAVEPLFAAVLKNKYYNGTLVYALETLNCGDHFRSLFDVLFHHGEVAQVSAYEILCEQEFLFENDDLLAIKAEWESIKADPEKWPKNGKILKWMENAVDSFITYLD